MRVELHNNEPPPPTAEWTEVSEVSFRFPRFESLLPEPSVVGIGWVFVEGESTSRCGTRTFRNFSVSL